MKRRKPRHIETDRARIVVTRLRRRVRVKITMKPDLEFAGQPNPASFGYADLDESAVARLVRRLTQLSSPKQKMSKKRELA